jgi:radical SAM superfamily enzyme YgiQ (UPF0313 family)
MIDLHYQTSMSLLYLSAIVKRERPDVDIEVLHLEGKTIEESVELIRDKLPVDVIGYTSTTLDYPTVLDIKLRLAIRSDFRNLDIIGGPHASACNLNDGWDVVFKGEGELLILDFIDDWKHHKNITYKIYDGRYIQHLDWLPYPDRDMNPYLRDRDPRRKTINIVASRGCAQHCSFCASHLTWTRSVRWRNTNAVAEEIRYCIDKYGIKSFKFSDENIASNKEWVNNFSNIVKPLGIEWHTIARVDSVDKETLLNMAASGCKSIAYGIESFDKNVLKILNKQATPEQAIETINNTYDAGISPNLLMMINTPGETWPYTADINIEYLEKVKGKYNHVGLKPLIPLPGTNIERYPEKFGVKIINRDYSNFNIWTYYKDEHGEKKLVESSLSIDGITTEQQRDNHVRLLNYIESQGVKIE